MEQRYAQTNLAFIRVGVGCVVPDVAGESAGERRWSSRPNRDADLTANGYCDTPVYQHTAAHQHTSADANSDDDSGQHPSDYTRSA